MDAKSEANLRCDRAHDTPAVPMVALPVLPGQTNRVRKSRTSRWRTLSLLAVHFLIIGHIVHWLVAERTLSPVEPSEAMYSLNNGEVNAGLIFFALSLVVTIIFGRFFCGWGCHVVAYQDLCTWLLKRAGIRPKQFRSRIPVFAPLALALYMFVWPSVYRLLVGRPFPAMTNHLLTTEFWKTFPGPVVAVATIVVCGFLVVYFLGSKGFCTYGCPYGGFYGVADQVAPGRILVNDACEQCGHCTAACTSNVRVHEEVALFGMVVDPGCMKCMDCVSVCPNDALRFGFAKPSAVARPASPPRPRPYDFTVWEELLMVAVGFGALLAFRGLYGRIPLLLAVGMAGITAYLAIKAFRLVRSANVRFQNLQLKRGGRLTQTGVRFAACAALLFALTGHSAVVRYQSWRGQRVLASLEIGDRVWAVGNDWWEGATEQQRSRVDGAIGRLEFAERWGFASTPSVLETLTSLYVARGDLGAAEAAARMTVELMPDRPSTYHVLAGVVRKAGRVAEAEESYREALRIDSSFAPARGDLGMMLRSTDRHDGAIELYRDGVALWSDDTKWVVAIGRTLMERGRFAEAKAELRTLTKAGSESATVLAALGVAELQTGETESGVGRLRRALELEPRLAEARYNLALALLATQRILEAIEHLERVVVDRPDFAEAHYNLGVAVFMSGRPAEALPHLRESLRLSPEDEQARAFLSMLRSHINNE